MKKGYEFDDVMLIPKLSTVESRDNVDTRVQLGPIRLDIPIIASPMKGIIGPRLIIELDRLGGLGILHRFYAEDHILDLEEASQATNWGAAIGLLDDYDYVLDYGCPLLCIDVANGYLSSVASKVDEIATYIKNKGYNTLVMAGNVVTADGANSLDSAGADLIRVGIGSGSLCITRQVTGVGVPQLSAIMDCDDTECKYLVADGGIKSSGDIVKALAAGADVVMMGSHFAKAHESENGGKIYGMASRRLQEEYYHTVKSIEGVEKKVEKTDTLENIINELAWGIKSACTYLNANNLRELHMNVEFMEV